MKIPVVAGIMLACLPGVAFARGMSGMGASPADQANMQVMQKMQNDMPKSGSGDPDRDFVTMMKPHHQGAIDMAKVELQYGKDPELRKMAQEIVRSQGREIERLNGWEAKHRR